MTDDVFEVLRDEIAADPANAAFTALGWRPLVVGSPGSKVAILSQAPGRRAQESGVPFNDASGDRLLRWLDVPRDRFDDPSDFAIVPMDFYYPGKGASGDLPPRRGIAAAWHPRILGLIRPRLTILVGAHAQRFHLGDRWRGSLTETVRAWREFAPEVVPVVHPSPLNVGWHQRHPWFEEELVPDLRRRVAEALGTEAPTADTVPVEAPRADPRTL
ncbi:uracil-DNA glycosylase family protein [Agromyces sp. CFH 90414]|uniref:Uracil-DNA glycosylase family protein n=1 Tax=Agromyces agglutinans TaxID=2662258 RepID=A0A6I2FL73_9MICO|nr:uracil-DNA glycosylase family protein [Agromyces agglutinans]MRG61378.1 uracil-DNA glycosylase family protein [Agromyces agglutinans]